jgi:hypothetical protein
MVDGPRQRLIERRQALLEEVARFRRKAESNEGNNAYIHRIDMAEKEAELDVVDAALAQSDLTQALQADTAAREAARAAAQAEQENTTFWYRRFMLSLQIGNGTGFLATLTAFAQADPDAWVPAAGFAFWPAYYFGGGVVAAGLLPLLAAFERHSEFGPRARNAMNGGILLLTTIAAFAFFSGVWQVGAQLYEISELRLPTHAADPAPPSPSPAPPPPAGGPSGSPAG